ncbi:hypothetical protein T265_03808 [Opisthorchis viverrini]|uniref:Uncharacterized protein n=1 Tax=Opisthorchis viverrini TaxID=6198 RepID=A0A075AHB8_OPIVI|nr:hypothetical protein T265_03808 [Opisthorchis viverrini]KER29609.1 hypothetical protein T265_03808 [Opisthorchis viverrini]
MTSVLNTNASLPYNHDLFESLIVEKRIKPDHHVKVAALGRALSNCLITDSPKPTHTSYGSETTFVKHLKTSQFLCSNRPITNNNNRSFITTFR